MDQKAHEAAIVIVMSSQPDSVTFDHTHHLDGVVA